MCLYKLLQMQTFKEIPYQNYIELKFSQRNINELTQQQALVKYKRNAKLLAEIFSFEDNKRQAYQTEDHLNQQQLKEFEKQLKRQEHQNKQKIEQTKQKSKKYEELSASIKEVKSKEELFTIIDELKKYELYDEQHPFFVENSPFYLSTTEEQFLEVTKTEEISEEGLYLIELN